VVGGKQEYIGRRFVDDGFRKGSIVTSANLPVGELIAFSEKKARHISLSPLALFCTIEDSETKHLGFFSKFTDRNRKTAQYLSLDGHTLVDTVAYSETGQIDLLGKFKTLQDIFADPDKEEIYSPNLKTTMSLDSSALDIGEIGKFNFKLLNKNSVDLKNISCVIEFPATFKNIEWKSETDSDSVSRVNSQNLIKIHIEEFDNGDSREFVFQFDPELSGNYTIYVGLVAYKYYRKESDATLDKLTDEEIEVDNFAIEVTYPNSRDTICPVINVDKNIYKESKEIDEVIEIGDDFIFEVALNNIGMGAARKVSLEILFPIDVKLVDGVEKIRTSMNPGELRKFKYTLRTRHPSIYNTIVRDIMYFDSSENRYITQVNDDYRVMVRSNLLKEFQYLPEDAYQDLYISTNEKNQIDGMYESNEHITDEFYRDCEHSAIVQVMRNLVKTLSKRRGLNVREDIYTESKRQASCTGKPVRMSLIFFAKNLPFFAIDLTDKDDMRFWSLTTPLSRQHDVIQVHTVKYKKIKIFSEGLNVTRTSLKLPEQLIYNKIKFESGFGKNELSKWINMFISMLQEEFLPWLDIVTLLTNQYEFKKIERGYDYVGLLCSENIENELMLEQIYVSKNFKKRNSYNICFEGTRDQQIRKCLRGAFSKICTDDVIYTAETKNVKFEPDEEDRVNRYLNKRKQVSDKLSVDISVKGEKDYPRVIDKINTLVDYYRAASSSIVFQLDQFAKQIAIQTFINRMPELIKTGLALRLSQYKKSIEIYSYKHHTPGTTEIKDCIGILDTRYSGWRLNLIFFAEPNLSEEVLSKIIFKSNWFDMSSGQGICLGATSGEDVDTLIDVLTKVAPSYGPEKQIIWPGFLKKEMLVKFGRREIPFFPLIKVLTDGTERYSEIAEIFKNQELDKELEIFLKINERFSSKFRREAVFVVKGVGEERTITINDHFLPAISELIEENPELNFLEAGDRESVRNYLNVLKQSHPSLSTVAEKDGYIDNWGSDIFIPFGLSGTVLIKIQKKALTVALLTANITEEKKDKTEKFYQELYRECYEKFAFPVELPPLKI